MGMNQQPNPDLTNQTATWANKTGDFIDTNWKIAYTHGVGGSKCMVFGK